jgi:hypothetical protein
MLPSLIGIIASSGGAAAAGDYESIATVTVGSGGSSSISFTSIPSTYQHLQVRAIQRCSSGVNNLQMQLNSDTRNNYSTHRLGGTGEGVFADATTSTSGMKLGLTGLATSTFGATIVDLLDYANVNKYKTVRSLNGFDENGVRGYILLTSGLWMNTNAVTSITIYPSADSFQQYSSFALYGIKG